MDLKEILSVSGKPGLYRLVSKGMNKIVVESLVDKSKMPLFASSRASALNNIAIYTDEDSIPLKDVFKKIFEKENGGKCVDPKSVKDDDLKKYLAEVLPEYDRERVHVSDMKKLFIWYNILHDNNLLVFDEKQDEEEKEEK